jgi:hypothetical protein
MHRRSGEDGKRDAVKSLSAHVRRWTSQVDVRRIFVFGLMFAFLSQAQLAAAHFHIGIDAKEQALFGLPASKAPGKGKAPLGDQDCPISKLVAACHNYVTGSGIVLALPTFRAERVAVQRHEARPVALIALNWQSRAPPSDFSWA